MERSIPRLALAGLGITVLAVVLVTGATSTSSLGTHNPSWDGTSELRSIADGRSTTDVVRNVSAYDETSANGTLAVVLSPAEPYGQDAAALRRFLDRGGTVLVAEDFRSNGNRLLASFGASARFDGRPVRDERNYERTPAFVRTSVATDRALAGDAETLVLNRGTVLDPGAATVLANTSRDAYLDGNNNEGLDETESPAARPVLAVESVGDGRVVVLSDPSVLINSMLEYGDNRAFVTALLEGHDRVLFDVSHSSGVPPLAAAVLIVRDSFVVQVALGTVLIVGVAGRHRLGGLLRRLASLPRDRTARDRRGTAPVEPDAVARAVRRDHPSWDEDRVERIAESAVGTRRPGESAGETTTGDSSRAAGGGADE